MKITNIINEKTVRVRLNVTDKTELINSMIELAGTQDKVLDKEKMRTAIFEREKIMSTGVGSGFAIPHGKTDAVSDIVGAFATTSRPVDYQSLDGQPVQLVFLLIGRENTVGTHIKLLSRISRMMNKEEFREKLIAAQSPAAVLELFREEESAYMDV